MIKTISLSCLWPSVGEHQAGEPNPLPSAAEPEAASGAVPVQPEQPQPPPPGRGLLLTLPPNRRLNGSQSSVPNSPMSTSQEVGWARILFLHSVLFFF